jgi:cellulose synthase (UDP-forming)
MTRYLVWINNGVLGPFNLSELASLDGFGTKTLVCSEVCDGTDPKDWKTANDVPEISNAFKKGILFGNEEASISAIKRGGELSDIAAAVASLKVKIEGAGDNKGDSLAKLNEGEEEARFLLSRLRNLERDLRSDSAFGQSGISGRRAQAAAAMRADLNFQIGELGLMINQIRRVRSKYLNWRKEDAEDRLGSERKVSLSSRKTLEYLLLERVAAFTGKWTFIAISVALSLRYLLWRAFYTLNYSSNFYLLISASLLAAEIYGFISVLLFFIQVINVEPVRPAPLEGEAPTVDLFITIYNEPLSVLEMTLIACEALDYPPTKLHVHVLDDGPRAEVEKMARSFGFDYMTRSDRVHAKAGNLNAALIRTHAEFLMLLDVDHIPVRSYLKETLGFFKDPKVAFVQTPHHFYNPDCYQKNLILQGEITNEQDLFFQLIEPGKNSANAVIFAGSSAVFRRAALLEIGGFKVDCAIEDMHTGMELESRGWKGVYYKRILSAALSPENFSGYLTQRRRWVRGGVQLFFLDNPLFKKGLTLRQRLFYFSSLIYFFHGWARLIYLLAPLSFLLMNCNPIVSPILTLMWYFIPHYFASHMVFSLLTREYRNPFWSDVYESASSFTLSWTAFATLFRPDFLIFHVTPKGLDGKKGHFGWQMVIPHLALCGLLIVGIIRTVYHFSQGHVALDSFLLSGFWAAFNFILMAASLAVARERPSNRRDIRMYRSYPATIHTEDGREFFCRTKDISLSGAMLEMKECVDLPKKALIRIIGNGDTVLIECAIRYNLWSKSQGARVGINFNKISPVQSHQIVRLIFSAPDSWENVHRPLRDSAGSFKDIVVASFSQGEKKRGANEAQAIAPSGSALLIFSGIRLRVHLNELGLDHAVVSWPRGFNPKGRLVLWIPGQAGKDRFIPVRIGNFLGGADGQLTFNLIFENGEIKNWRKS